MRIIFIISLIINILTLSYSLPAYATENLNMYSSATEAQAHCPDDEVVWLNVPTGIWHISGSRWYGNTKHGVYVCKREATAAGDRASLNG